MPDYRMKWIRIWPHAWFDSSMRVELTNEERAFWVDLIALAGKSRIPGVICSDPDGKVGYPLPMLCSLLVSWTPEQTAATLAKLEKTERAEVRRTPLLSGEEGWIVRVVNWDKYQSESQRIQKYRNTARSEKRNRQGTLGGCTTGRIEVEVEVEEEREVDKRKKSAQTAPLADWIPLDAWAEYRAMRERIKKPMTQGAVDLAVRTLAKLKSEGHDPREVLEQSTLNAWAGLFPVRQQKGQQSRATKRTENNLRAAGFIA